MRVLVDATPLLGARTGVGVFTAHLLKALEARPGLDVGRFSVARRGTIPVPARAAHALWRRLDWPPLFKGADAVHGTNFVVPPTRAARIVTVHDLTVLRFPDLVAPATRAYPGLIRQAVRHGAWVHTPSAFVAAEVVAAFPVDPAKVRAIPHGVVTVDPTEPAYDFPYVLALGTIEPRKDLPSLVRAFDGLAPEFPEVRLVVAGPDGWGTDAFDAAVARSPFARRIIRLGHVDDHGRQKLLAGAAVLAYPSLYEGFGLPPLEAMSAGVAVVAARAGGVTEAVGDAAVLVEPGDADALAQALALVLTDDGLRADLVERGRKRAAELRWEDTAAAMEDLYRDAACAS